MICRAAGDARNRIVPATSSGVPGRPVIVATAERRFASGQGSRRVEVSLTPSGHALVWSLVDRVLGREADLVADLSSDQRQTLTDLLRILLDDLQRRLGPASFSQVGSD